MKDQKQKNARRFAEQLRLWLNEKGFTQAELARRSHLTPQTISQYVAKREHHLTGKLILPEIDTVDQIARALGIPIAEARAAAGYAHEPLPQLDAADKFAMVFRELTPERQQDVLKIMATFQSADPSAERDPIDDFVTVAEKESA